MADKQKIPSHTKKGNPKRSKKQKKLDTSIVTQSATKNTSSTKKQYQLSRQERFRLAFATQDFTECANILESAGYSEESLIFMLSWLGGVA